MTTFGLITEGKTDQIVIENILIGYFKNWNLDMEPLLPLRDETDKHSVENYSNWLKVFEYCGSSLFKGAFQYCDYIIVHIDTDTSEEEGYDIPKHQSGRLLEPEDLIKQVRKKFKGLIGEEFYNLYQDNIIFAIAVHSTECWLLPLLYQDKRKARTLNCITYVDRALKLKNSKLTLQTKAKKKNEKSYEAVSSQYNKQKRLLKVYAYNPSLKTFIDELEQRNITIEDDSW